MPTVKPRVILLTHTAAPEKVIAGAAKLCYSGAEIEDLLSGIDEEGAGKFVDMLSSIGHESPIEHASFTFGIEGVSRTFLAQITRHRIASYSVQSQRYVEKSPFGYVCPPEIAEIPQAAALFEEAMDACGAYYDKLTELLSEKHEKAFLAAGETEKSAKRLAKKRAIEDARFVLPGACDTKMIVTMNARSLQNFFKHRLCNRAQWEIREVAKQMYKLVYAVAPTLFSHSGPPCLYGPCPEGKMSCKKQAQVREEYAAMKERLGQ